MSHGYLVALDPPRKFPPRRWQCKHCKATGTLAEVQARKCAAGRPATDDELIEAIDGPRLARRETD